MRLTPKLLRLQLSIVLVSIGFASASVLAQPLKPTSSVRSSLVSALNGFLTTNSGVTSGTIPFSFSDGGLYLEDALDGCEVINPLNIDVEFTPTHFILRRTLRAGGTLPVDYDNRLASDLNAWLNAVWALNLKGVDVFDALGFQCVDGVTPSDNRFYTKEVDATAHPEIISAIQELTGENNILNTYYVIQGNLVKGSDFISFAETSPRVVRYMTDRGDPALPAGQRDTIRYLGNAYIKIDLTGWGGEEFTFLFHIQTTPYHTTPPNVHDEPNCGISQQVTDPMIWSGMNNFDAEIRTYLGPPTSPISNSYCAFGWLAIDTAVVAMDWGYKDDPDEASEMMFEYMSQHSGDWIANPQGEGFVSKTSTPDTRIEQLGYFLINSAGKLVFREYWSGCCDYWNGEIGVVNETIDYDEEVCVTRYCRGGEFVLDPDYKTLLYEPPVTCPDCSTQPVPCMTFCDSALPVMAVKSGVIKSDARLFTDKTPLVDESEFLPFTPNQAAVPWYRKNDFERGMRGKWRSTGDYVYRTVVKPGSGAFGPVALPSGGAGERNYNDAGVYDLTLFSWRIPDVNDPLTWLKPTNVTRYSQNGEPVEEVDIFGIPNAARFAYDKQVPILVAKNATYNSTLFESFEDGKGNDNLTAHAGDYSLWVRSSDWAKTNQWAPVVIGNFTVDQHAIDNDLLIRFWARQYYEPDPTSVTTDAPVDIRLEWTGGMIDIPAASASIKFIAKTGEWGLYEAEVTTLTNSELNKEVTIKMISAHPIPLSTTEEINGDFIKVWVDDFRMQPMTSEMVCYVYDADNLRQAAVFDDQHFGVFFQYNGEGKLIRRIRETERGMKTVQETQYNTPLVDRDYGSSTVTYAEGATKGDFTPASFREGGIKGGGGNNFDLLNLDLGLDRQSVKIFGLEGGEAKEKLEDVKKLLKNPSIAALKIPEVEKLRLLNELAQIEEEHKRLESIDTAGVKDEAKKRAWEESVRQLSARRAELMEQLGIPEGEVQSIIREVEQLRENSDDGKPDTEQTEETTNAAGDN